MGLACRTSTENLRSKPADHHRAAVLLRGHPVQTQITTLQLPANFVSIWPVAIGRRQAKGMTPMRRFKARPRGPPPPLPPALRLL